jgi:hypothetical protein
MDYAGLNSFSKRPDTVMTSISQKRTPCFVNLTGKRSGRLEVLGQHVDRSRQTESESGIRWVCACDCGRFSVHQGKVIKQKKVTQCDMCERRDYYGDPNWLPDGRAA